MFFSFLKINETETVTWMIKYYCKSVHGLREPCVECIKLLEYALTRISRCPHKTDKPVCSACDIHCYSREYRERIIEVMKYSGPRIMFHKPVTGIKYLIRKKLNKRNKTKKLP